MSSKELKFEVYQEKDLTWEQHNKIHEALNTAYGYRTNAFANKTYSYHPPLKRIICVLDNKIVGHTSILDAHLIYKSEHIKFAGIGMTLSLKPFLNLAYQLRQRAVSICALEKYPFAIGRVKNSKKVKNNLQNLVSHFLDIPLIGQSTQSHSWETLAFYDTGYDKSMVEEITNYCLHNKQIKIEGEIF